MRYARFLTIGRGLRVAAMCLGLLAAAPAAAQVQDEAPLRFGILPMAGPLESRQEWEPLLAALSRAIGRPVQALSVTSYQALDTAISRHEVDLAFLSAKMALDAVAYYGMTAVAQEVRPSHLPANRAVLIGRKNRPPADLATMLAAPGQWRFAGGEPQSMSGYLIPQLQLFLPHKLRSETFFASEVLGTDQDSALAVANGEADVGTNSTANLERFQQRFPQEYARLAVLWESDPIPPSQVVMRRTMPAALRDRIRGFLASYGHADGPQGEIERAALKHLQDASGFQVADDAALLPVALLAYQLATRSALSGQWVSEGARQARLARINADYAQQLASLRQDGGGRPTLAAH